MTELVYKVLDSDMESPGTKLLWLWQIDLGMLRDVGLVIPYCAEQWREPVIPHSGLFAFDSYETAHSWRDRRPNLSIWMCEAESPIEIKSLPLSMGLSGLPSWWAQGRQGIYKASKLPKGTVVYKRLRPVWRLEDE